MAIFFLKKSRKKGKDKKGRKREKKTKGRGKEEIREMKKI